MQRTIAFVGGVVITAVVVVAVAHFEGGFSIGSGGTPFLGPVTTIGGDCRGKDCDFEITVSCEAGACAPSVDKDRVKVDRTHKLRFTITTPGYKFDPSDGIKFNKDNAQIDCSADGDQKFKCPDTSKSPPGEHRYQIHVQGLAVLDPTIIVY